MTNKNKVLIGILGAAAAGVVIGMLVAPDKGKDIRKKIKRTAGDWADNLTNMISKAKHSAEDAVDEIREKARTTKSAAEDKVNKLKENYS